MKKKFMKVLSTLLVVIMLLTSTPLSGFVGLELPKWLDSTIKAKAEDITVALSNAVEFNGHYYKIFDENMSWHSAKTYCEELGGHLVTITSQEENTFISSLLDKNYYFIGASDEEHEGEWKWVTGELWSYTNWDPLGIKEPNNSNGNQNYLAIYGKSCGDTDAPGGWDDAWSTGNADGFVCEWEAENIESQLMLNAMPKMSDTDARAFLGFIYGNMDKFATADLKDDIQYQLLTGTLSKTKSVEEIKALIDAFSLVVQREITTYASESQYNCDCFLNSLISRLERELGELKSTDQQIISQYTNATSKYFEEGLTDLFTGAVGRITGININDSHLMTCRNIIGGIETIASIPSKLEEFYNRVFMVSDIFDIIVNHEKAGRYLYFSSYLEMRPILDREEFAWYYDVSFNSISGDYFASKALDWFTPLTGKDSWANHRDDIERYADFMLSLAQIQQQDFHNYSITKHLPSCTENGYTEYNCVYCDEYYVDDVTKPIGHKYLKTTVAPTCEEQGYDLYQCKNCVKSYKENYKNALGHSANTKEVIAPTCTVDGCTINYCKCGYEWITDITLALQHNYKQTVVDPTEIKQGYTINECLNCGDAYNSDYINPTGHDYVVTKTEPTCEQDGLITHTCACGETYSETITAIGHDYKLESYIVPTCITHGTKMYKCTNCDNMYVESIDALDHDYTYKIEFVEPTCTEQGYSINYCVCDAITKSDYIVELGHSYNILENVDSSCTLEGSITSKCEVCGDITTEFVPALGEGHIYEFVESSELSCVTSQYDLYKCSVCEKKKYENVKALTGHMYNLSNANEPICTLCGISRYNIGFSSSQIRFDRKEDGSYAKTFAVRTRAKIWDEDFKALIGATNEEAISKIEKVGFVYTLDGDNFSTASAQNVAQGGVASGYVDAPVSYIQDADGYFVFTCVITNIPHTETDAILTAYAYICVGDKWYFSEEPMYANFNYLYAKYYPLACEAYCW